MQIIKLSQTNDREAWLDARRGLITGSKAKGIKPLTRGTDRTPAGFWELLAERLSVAKDGEPDMDRGQRLENEALQHTADKYGIEFDLDAGMWVSDEIKGMAVSPDSAEYGDKPTYAGEAKCLATKNHLQAVVADIRAKKLDGYQPFNSVPKEYQDQVLQYFAVNPHLQKVYFTLYDDRIALNKLMHHVIIVERTYVQDRVDILLQIETDVLEQIKETIGELLAYDQT